MSFQVAIGSLGGTMFFQAGRCTPLRTMNLHDICIYHLSTFYFQKNNGGKGHNQISTKTCYEIKKISTFLLKGEGLQFLKKKPNLNLKCLTTNKVDNFFSLLVIQTRKF